MATATISPSLLLIAAPKCASRPSPKLCFFNPSLPLTSPARPGRDDSAWKSKLRGDLPKSSRLWRVSAAAEEALVPETAAEKARQIIPAAAEDSAASTIISALLFIAFIVLSLLTVGVIYLAVQDFLQKREREKFEKEETEKKKAGKKARARARTGPRGFGQKIEEDED